MNGDFYIFTGGHIFADTLDELSLSLCDEDFVIAADSGYNSACRLGVKPDMLLGDLDSVDKASLDGDDVSRMERIIVSPIKDDTDTQLAVDTAISRGAGNIIIVGGLGGRLDHTLSSVFLLEYIAERNVGCMMTDGRNRVHILRSDGETRTITVTPGYKYLSLVSLTDRCEGVSITGVYYPLDSVELTRKYSYAVSNEITADEARISLCRGTVLVIESRD